MTADKSLSFLERLSKFKKEMMEAGQDKEPMIVLVIIANTHDAEIAGVCTKDAAAINKIFKNICTHSHYNFCQIEISDDSYNRENLFTAIDSIDTANNNDVLIVYYSGHGFGYENDGGDNYPQIDLRARSDKARYSKIDFINKHTENLSAILQLLRLRGARINIVIGDCCSSKQPFLRTTQSQQQMDIVNDLLQAVNTSMTRKLFTSQNHTISIVASATRRGQLALGDPKIGSLFTHSFTRELANTLTNEKEGDPLFHWQQILEKVAAQTLELSKQYDIAPGKKGHQLPVFEILVEEE